MLRALTLDVLKLAAEGGLVFYDWAPDGLVCVAFIVLLVQYCWAEKKKKEVLQSSMAVSSCASSSPPFSAQKLGTFHQEKTSWQKAVGAVRSVPVASPKFRLPCPGDRQDSGHLVTQMGNVGSRGLRVEGGGTAAAPGRCREVQSLVSG